MGHEKKKGKKAQGIRKLMQTLNHLILGVMYSQRGYGEAGLRGPEGLPCRSPYLRED